MKKSGKYGPDYSREREFKVILEDLQSQFGTFGEGLDDVRERVGHIEHDVADLKNDVGDLKLNMSFVKKVLPTLATKDEMRKTITEATEPLATKKDLQALERRLVALESTH